MIDHSTEIAQNVQWLGYTPFGSAFAIAYHVAAGNWALAGLSLVLSLIYLGGAWVLWGRSLERSMRNVSGEQKRGKAKNLTAGDIGILRGSQTLVGVLWLHVPFIATSKIRA